MKRVLLSLLVLCWAQAALAVPLNDVQLAQAARFPFDTTLTVKEAMERYSYFERVTWQVYYDINNRKVVEVRGYYNMAKVKTRTDSATCVTREGTFVGLTDTQAFMILQYRPDFIKQRAELVYSGIWGLYDDQRLDDPDLLWAKALVTDELPSPTPLCNMKLDQISPLDQLAIQEEPVHDPGATAPAKQTPQGTPRASPATPKGQTGPTPKSAAATAKQIQDNPPTPTKTGR
ncbi:MAG: hypothetical protein HY795_03415 [Desulfovibrio sp.]|nr:hypothetical protein [Desulfovibrio sp.]MBI4959101.1 hypothetical protein [Desulfovibrio sp.]